MESAKYPLGESGISKVMSSMVSAGLSLVGSDLS